MGHTVTHVTPPPPGFVIQDAVNVTPPPPGFEIVQAATQQVADPSDPGFIEGVSQDLSARGEAISAAGEQALAGETTGLESDATILSQAILGVGDVGVRALDAAAGGLEAITPEPIRNAVNQFETDVRGFASEQIDALLDTDIGQAGLEAFQGGVELFQQFADENPRIAKQVENAAIIGSTAIGGIGGRAVTSGAGTGGLRRIAQGVDNRIAVQLADRRQDFIQGLVAPKETAATKAAAGARKVEEGTGIFKRGVVPPTSDQIRMSNTISEIPGVSNKNTITGNKVEIQNALTEEVTRINTELGQFKTVLPKNRIDQAFADIETQFGEEVLLAGASEGAAAQRVLDIAKKQLKDKPKTPKGILDARRAFDRELRRQRPKVFEATNENVMTSAIRIVRRNMNDLVSEGAPSANVRQSLSRQSNMLDALDVIAPKSQAEATSAFGRMISAATEATGLKTKLEKGLGALTITLGTAAIDPKIAAGLAGTVLAGAGLKRAAASTLPKKAISQALKASDRLLTTVTDPDKLRQLGADRLIIASFLSELEQQEE